MIILSFVVQNYPTQHYVTKTKRYKDVTRFCNTALLVFMLKLNLLDTNRTNITVLPLYLSHLHYSYFTSKFWKLFKRSFTFKFGTVTSNLTKTASYLSYTNLLKCIDPARKLKPELTSLKFKTIYVQENTLVPFSFQSTTYNTLMYFIITLLVTFYTPTQSEFKLFYSYIWRSHNLLSYDFLNHFYFKLKNY